VNNIIGPATYRNLLDAAAGVTSAFSARSVFRSCFCRYSLGNIARVEGFMAILFAIDIPLAANFSVIFHY
jgi:hypothetical protein